MPKLKEKINTGITAPLERFLGQDTRVTQRVHQRVNECIETEFFEVAFTENQLPEEHACLYLFPIADGKYSMQILYLQHSDTPFTADICWLHLKPGFFEQYPAELLLSNMPFRFDQTTEQQFNICAQSQALIGQLAQTKPPTDFLGALQQTETALHLLRRALEHILVPFTACQVPACRFLAYESEREKIAEARRILDSQYDQPLTIKELSRKVAMNECYLKKGFKSITGRTIHEYQQELRISKAKELLKRPGYSVSNVAAQLGYSSISHFSTAFKKATGLKPCELLG